MKQLTTTAFGIDLAGYSTGKLGLAKAVRSGTTIEVTIYRNHALSTLGPVEAEKRVES